MMKNNILIQLLFCSALIIAGGLCFLAGVKNAEQTQPQINLGGSVDVPNYNKIGTAGTSTTQTIGSSSGFVLATSTGRTYATIVATVAMYCNLNQGAPAVAGSGIYLPTSTPLILNYALGFNYVGTVNCIAVAAGVTGTASVYSK